MPRPGSGSNKTCSKTACPSSITCGRRRPGVRSSATPGDLACSRSSPARAGLRCPGSKRWWCHRRGTIEVETAFLRHAGVAEAGVTARPDPVRMEVIAAFVVLKKGYEPSEELRRELLETVRRELGPVAVIGDLNFVSMLPKTRSGKIMRRVLKAVTLDKDPGDISTIEDAGSVQDAREAWEAMRREVTLR